jgi:type I restriction enzyme, S subunit
MSDAIEKRVKKRGGVTWESHRLKFLVDVRNEKVEAEQTNLPYMGLEHIESWTSKRIEDESATSEGVASRFEQGDVLFGKLRPYLAKVYLAEAEGMASTEAIVLTPKDGIVAGYLKFVLLSREFIDSISGAAYGVKMPRANWDFIGGMPIMLPSLEQQAKISNFLDFKTGQVDKLIAKKCELLEKLKERRLAVIAQAVTKGLDPNTPMRDSGVHWIGRIPKSWDCANLRRFAVMKTGHTPSRNEPAYWEDCEIPWFGLVDVWQLRDGTRMYLGGTKEKISMLGLENSAAELLPAGTVVFSRTASVGFSGVMPVPMATTQDFWNWIPEERLLPEYLLFLFRAMTQEFERLTMGSTHKTIYQPDAASLRICLPSISEQRAIVAYIIEATGKLDELAAKTELVIANLQEYRSALITAAVTGRVVVHE